MKIEALIQPPTPPSQKKQKKHPSPQTQILDMQAVLFNLTKNQQTAAKDAAACARAWEVLEERKRILRGKPLPGQRRPAPDRPEQSKPKVVAFD